MVSLSICVFPLYHPLCHSLQGVWAYSGFLTRVNSRVFVSRIKHATCFSTNLPLARITGSKCSGDSCWHHILCFLCLFIGSLGVLLLSYSGPCALGINVHAPATPFASRYDLAALQLHLMLRCISATQTSIDFLVPRQKKRGRLLCMLFPLIIFTRFRSDSEDCSPSAWIQTIHHL